MVLERKGVDPVWLDNRMIFIVASNEASVVPADKGDRRWMVLEVGDQHREDHAYFAAIGEQLDQGGYAAMLYELIHRRWREGPAPRRTIKSEALFDQVLMAQPAELRFLYSLLDEGRLPQNWIAGAASTTIRALYEEFKSLHRAAAYMDNARLGRFINKVIPVRTSQGGMYFVKQVDSGFLRQRSTRYDFPPLPAARAAFQQHVDLPIRWSEAREWQADPDPRDDDPHPGGDDLDGGGLI